MKNTRIKHLLPALCFLCISITTWAQTTVSGVVLDDTDMTLIGVNVMEKGTTNGTITDFDGKFTLSVKNTKAVLVFSYIGYQTVEMQASTSPMKIVMKEDSKALDEVVVIGYQDVRKKDLTGSVSKANVEDILKAPVASFDQALAGRIAGVNVSSGEGMPGGTMNIVIRGNNSLTQDNSPLYVIDGFPVEDAALASTINPADIESLDILKDASATAIYGARGANGVVIITTKKGSIGKPQITYDGSSLHQLERYRIHRRLERCIGSGHLWLPWRQRCYHYHDKNRNSGQADNILRRFGRCTTHYAHYSNDGCLRVCTAAIGNI